MGRFLLSAVLTLSVVVLVLTMGDDPSAEDAKPPVAGKSAETGAAKNDRKGSKDEESEPVAKVLLSGKVVPLSEALTQRGIKNYAGEVKGQIVLVTRSGELVPIVADWRGRAFYQDERLRNRPVDLIAHRRAGVPWVQVLSIYVFDEKGARCLMDYWCEICSIPMYEIQDCECCQGPIELRLRPRDLPRDVK